MKHTYSHKEVIETLKKHLLPCFYDINEFDILYTEDKLQSEMLDEVAPNFFRQLNKMYFDKFILSISRLLDPSKQLGFENLSLPQLIEIAKESNYPKIDELIKIIDSLKKDSADILKLRSKFIAHRDLIHSINNDLYVSNIELGKIKETFWEMARCINSIETHLGLEISSFLWLKDQDGVTSLLRHLKDSLVYRDIRINIDDWDKDDKEAQVSKYYQLKV